VKFDRLFPPGDPVDPLDALIEQAPWERAFEDRPRVLVNMISTLDGRITIDGRAGPIGGDGDRALFQALRTVVDCVLVGTGTLRVERYGRIVRSEERRARRAALGLEPDALALLVTRTGQLDWGAPLFDAPEQRVIVVTHPQAVEFPRVAAQVERIEIEAPTPAAALRELHRRHGTRIVLCEGGPTLNRGLLADGVLDELYLSLGPLLVGGEEGLRILAGDELPQPVQARLATVLHHEGELFLRYVVG